MKLLKAILPIIFITTSLYYSTSAKPYDYERNRDNYRHENTSEEKDCDDLLAECGDKCNEMDDWWWNKKKCEKKCIEDYKRCIQEW